MDFCECCDNMMYVKLDSEENLLQYCKNCDHQVLQMRNKGSYQLIHDNKVDDETRYFQSINKNIIFYQTLHHVNNIYYTN